MSDSPETPIPGAGSPVDTPADPTPTDDSPETAQDESGRTFDYEYVKGLREEAKSWRLKSVRADELESRLHAQLTKADGRLADPLDLPFDAEHLTNPDAHAQAIADLIAAHPHYASRRPAPGTSIGQGQQGSPVAPPPSLIDAIKAKQGR